MYHEKLGQSIDCLLRYIPKARAVESGFIRDTPRDEPVIAIATIDVCHYP